MVLARYVAGERRRARTDLLLRDGNNAAAAAQPTVKEVLQGLLNQYLPVG